jgi:two-component system CheB/CheR fusion protein
VDSAAPILEAGQLVGAVAVFLDKSDRLRAEQAGDERRGRLELQASASEEALGHSRQKLLALSARLMNAQEEERRRVARELHDDLSQHAALAEFEAGRMEQMLPVTTGEAQERIRSMRGHIRMLNIRLHEIAYGLHPSILEDIGLAAAIRSLAEEYRRAGLEVRLTVRDTPPDLSISVATALYRITQEALRNAYKHAAAAEVRLTLIRVGGEFRLTVEDAGPGFDLLTIQRKGGLGLLSMEERARLAGGSLLVRTQPGCGTLLLVRVPAEG